MALSFNSAWMDGSSHSVGPIAGRSNDDGSIGACDTSSRHAGDDASLAVTNRLTSLRALVGDAFTRQTYLHSHRPTSAGATVKGLLRRAPGGMASATFAGAHREGNNKNGAGAFSDAASLRAGRSGGVARERPSTAASSPPRRISSFDSTCSPTRDKQSGATMPTVCAHGRPASAMLRSTQSKLEMLLSEENASNVASRQRAEAQYAAQLAEAAGSAKPSPRLREEHDPGAVLEIGDEDVDSVDPRLLLSGGEEGETHQMCGVVRPGSAVVEREARQDVLRDFKECNHEPSQTTSASTAAATPQALERRPPQAPKKGTSQTPSLLSSSVDTCLSSKSARPLSASTSPHGIHQGAIAPMIYAAAANNNNKPVAGTLSPEGPYLSDHDGSSALSCSSRRAISPDVCSVSSSGSIVPPLAVDGIPPFYSPSNNNSNNNSRPSSASSYAERFRKKLESLEASKPIQKTRTTTTTKEDDAPRGMAHRGATGTTTPEATTTSTIDVPCLRTASPPPHQEEGTTQSIRQDIAVAESQPEEPHCSPAASDSVPVEPTAHLSSLVTSLTPSSSPPPIALVEVTDAIDSFLGMHFFSLKSLEAELHFVEAQLQDEADNEIS